MSDRASLAVLILLGAALGCSRGPETPAALSGEAAAVLPFIENDFAAALSRAKEAKLPLFVEVWAPW